MTQDANIINALKKVHPECTARYDEWIYLYRSWLGGQAYRRGQYLRPYVRELDDEAQITSLNDQYYKRLQSTPYTNYVKMVMQTYRGFLCTQNISRSFGMYDDNEILSEFIKDVDLMGTNLDAFLLDFIDMERLYGSAWCIVDRTTTPDEKGRYKTYMTQFSPLDVVDWEGDERSGYTYLKIIEVRGKDTDTILEYTPDFITRFEVTKSPNGLMFGDYKNLSFGKILNVTSMPNTLGVVPVTRIYNLSDGGRSQMYDIADHANAIYNFSSEMEQTVRIESHQTLVANEDDQIGTGAGATIIMGSNATEGKTPYMLSGQASSVQSIRSAISEHSDRVDRLAQLSSIRGTQSTAMSGIALTVERQTLTAALTQISDLMRETEIKLWKWFALWENINLTDDMKISYDSNFNVRDREMEMGLLERAVELFNKVDSSPNITFANKIKTLAAELVIEDEDELAKVKKEININTSRKINGDDTMQENPEMDNNTTKNG